MEECVWLVVSFMYSFNLYMGTPLSDYFWCLNIAPLPVDLLTNSSEVRVKGVDLVRLHRKRSVKQNMKGLDIPPRF
jgi:hypothetical protein